MLAARWYVPLVAMAFLASLASACTGTNTMGDAASDRADGRANVDAGAIDSGPRRDVLFTGDARRRALDKLDILLEVDNSNSMRENQVGIMAQLGPLLRELTAPSDNNGDGMPDYPPINDMHVAVISSDLGSGGRPIPGCSGTHGDDGRLNPIRYGEAMAMHLPWTSAPPGFRPTDCSDQNQFPTFITFSSVTTPPTDVAGFEHDFRCNAGLYVGGCGLEQQLEAVYQALVRHDAHDRPGNTSPNAGFIRDDAGLVILMLTDEEDMSVRECRYAESGVACSDATTVYDTASTAWSSPNLNLRGYMYQSGSAQDPTWPLERYFDPANPNRGFPGLKPGLPECVVFAAITGVPLELPNRGGRTDWDALLGPPDPANRDNYNGRNAALAFNSPTNREGPISMRQANRDPQCSERVVPACRREGTLYDATNPQCVTTDQYFAWPARRIVEIARRFDEVPNCRGVPCRTGMVRSICSTSYSTVIPEIATLVGRCLEPPG